jgi:formamidopyrimidine-DNA glycosylase
MEGARIQRVTTRRAGLRYPFGDDFVARLEGQTVRALRRRAKYLVAELSSGDALIMHLGMSGWFRVLRLAPRKGAAYDHDPARDDKHDHVVFEMSSGATVVFNDPRRFGFMKVVSAQALAADRALSALGPEPLDRAFTAEVLAAAVRTRRNAVLKTTLLDQRVVAGLGNIYVCEALHRAALSPKRKAATLVSKAVTKVGAPTPAAVTLVGAIKAALRHAIDGRHRAGGDDRFLVYDHEGERCPRRGCAGTIRRIVQSGRSTFYCPACQRS